MRLMDHRARLAMLLLSVVALRATDAQPPATSGPRTAANYGQPQPPPFQFQQSQNPPAQQSSPPVANQALRYPLPEKSPAAAPPSQIPAQIPAQGPQTAVVPATSMTSFSPAPSQATVFTPAQIVGRVGDKTILYCDVAPTVNMRLEPALAKARSPEERQAMEAAYRDPLTKSEIERLAFNKMLFMEFERSMPSEMRGNSPDASKKRKESEAKLKKQIQKAFEGSLQAAREKVTNASPEDIEAMMKQDASIVRLALMMKDRKLESPGELDAVLRQYGTSLEQQVRDFGEYLMGMEAARNALDLNNHQPDPKSKAPKKNREVSHQELLDYYQDHKTDYYIPAKARFEILSARLNRFAGSREATRNAVAQMGNEVILGGTPFSAVAKKHSQEPHASEGGLYDWVTPGSLASKPIDQAVFSLEIGKLSQIIDDDLGCHIIRVLERKPPGQVPFHEVQSDIRDAIKEQRRNAERQKYLTDLRARTKVWTIYDPPPDEPAAAPK